MMTQQEYELMEGDKVTDYEFACEKVAGPVLEFMEWCQNNNHCPVASMLDRMLAVPSVGLDRDEFIARVRSYFGL